MMRALYVAAIILIAAIVLPAVLVAMTSPGTEANPPSELRTRSLQSGLSLSTPRPGMISRATMSAEPSRSDASWLLALKLELKLKPVQIQRVEEVVNENRLRDPALLTPEQQKSLTSFRKSSGQSISMNATRLESPARMKSSGERNE